MKSDNDIHDVVPDKEILPAKLAYEVLTVLDKSPEAAKHVYLVLSTKFGVAKWD